MPELILAILCVVFLVAFQLLIQRRKGRNAKLTEVREEEKELKSVYLKVISRIRDDKYYLHKSVKLSDLAEELTINERLVSRSINTYEKRNFNNLVNSYRIAHARDMMRGGSFNHYTIEAIADESGFSNKVSFYTAFKSEVGMSPSEFRASKQPEL